ncbi:uncharacterized protein LOC112693562 [Sipha flava]|uniref:Uncharacterized protein LOC112693562 n=1 Tax=Sipha flava TaxID=143950 RepID=A0A2S2R609_9HEMI|nr:uncharacterized protein LOC112693562 [Sipha flava]
MKLSFFFLFVSSTLVAQISSHEVSEFEHVSKNIIHSVYHLLELPALELDNTVPGKSLKNNIKMLLLGFSIDGQWFGKEMNKFLNNLLTPEMKTIKESVLENLSSLSPVKSPAKAMMISRDLLNDSFYKLPEDIQFKVLSIGHDIDELLRQLKDKYVDYRELKKEHKTT